MIYFEVVSALALIIGLVVVNAYQPGAGINADPNTLDTKAITSYTTGAQNLHGVDFVLNIIPDTIINAFAKGDVLEVLLFSVLFGAALSRLGERGQSMVDFVEHLSHALFSVIGMIMRVAPLGAFGAMAFTIGHYRLGTLVPLGKLMAGVHNVSQRCRRGDRRWLHYAGCNALNDWHRAGGRAHLAAGGGPLHVGVPGHNQPDW